MFIKYVLRGSPVNQSSMVQATPEISTIISSSFGMLVADIHGSIHLLNRDFESIRSWVAHVGGRVTHMVERRGVLVTLGVGPDARDEVSGYTEIPSGRRSGQITTPQDMGFGERG